MQPEDISNRDFFVGLRGYDKGEVDGFLAEVAASYRDLLHELEEAKAKATSALSLPPEPKDEIAELGGAVVAVLQSARDTAAELVRNAQAEADYALEHARSESERIRAEAVAEADQVRDEAARLRADVAGDALRAKQEAEQEVAELREEVKRVREQADIYAESRRSVADDYARQTRGEADEYAERVRTEVDAHRADVESRIDDLVRARSASLEHQVRDAVEAAVADTNERLQNTYVQLGALRSQMADAAEGIHLAMLSIGDDPEAMARASVEDAVTPTIDLTGMPTGALGVI